MELRGAKLKYKDREQLRVFVSGSNGGRKDCNMNEDYFGTEQCRNELQNSVKHRDRESARSCTEFHGVPACVRERVLALYVFVSHHASHSTRLLSLQTGRMLC